MLKKSKGLAALLLTLGVITFPGCSSLRELYTRSQIKPLTNQSKEYPLEGGKIMLRIQNKEAWQNFKNAMDLYTVARDKIRLTSDELYGFIYPSDKPPRDFLSLKECKDLRKRAREYYDNAILGKADKSKKSGIDDVEPDLPQ